MHKGFIATILLFLVSTSLALTLIWDPHSNQSQLANFKVYRGTNSGVYDKTIVVKKDRNFCILVGLLTNVPYYFTVTAVETNGIESDHSQEVTFVRSNQPLPFTTSVIKVTTSIVRANNMQGRSGWVELPQSVRTWYVETNYVFYKPNLQQQLVKQRGSNALYLDLSTQISYDLTFSNTLINPTTIVPVNQAHGFFKGKILIQPTVITNN